MDAAHLVARAQLQIHILSDSCSRTVWPCFLALLLPEFRPVLPFCDGVIDERLLEDPLDFACDLTTAQYEAFNVRAVPPYLDLLSIIVQYVFHGRADAILIDEILSLLCSDLMRTGIQ